MKCPRCESRQTKVFQVVTRDAVRTTRYACRCAPPRTSAIVVEDGTVRVSRFCRLKEDQWVPNGPEVSTFVPHRTRELKVACPACWYSPFRPRLFSTTDTRCAPDKLPPIWEVRCAYCDTVLFPITKGRRRLVATAVEFVIDKKKVA